MATKRKSAGSIREPALSEVMKKFEKEGGFVLNLNPSQIESLQKQFIVAAKEKDWCFGLVVCG